MRSTIIIAAALLSAVLSSPVLAQDGTAPTTRAASSNDKASPAKGQRTWRYLKITQYYDKKNDVWLVEFEGKKMNQIEMFNYLGSQGWEFVQEADDGGAAKSYYWFKKETTQN
jgi:hypothetical protein